jgi:hypothetical protein
MKKGAKIMSDKVRIPWAAVMDSARLKRKWFTTPESKMEMLVEGEVLTLEGEVVRVNVPVEHFLSCLGIELIEPEAQQVMMAPPGTALAQSYAASFRAIASDLEAAKSNPKTLNNSDINGARKQVSDLEVVGNGDMFQLLCKASSKAEDWMKSTRAMEIPGVGCVVQVTTQQGGQVAEATTFVPGVTIVSDKNGGRKLMSRNDTTQESDPEK